MVRVTQGSLGLCAQWKSAMWPFMKPKMALSFAKCERNVQVIQHHYSQCALHNMTTSAGRYVVLDFLFLFSFFPPIRASKAVARKTWHSSKKGNRRPFSLQEWEKPPAGTNCVWFELKTKMHSGNLQDLKCENGGVYETFKALTNKKKRKREP